MRSLASSFLGVGETVFDSLQATAVTSGYFRRSAGPRGGSHWDVVPVLIVGAVTGRGARPSELFVGHEDLWRHNPLCGDANHYASRLIVGAWRRVEGVSHGPHAPGLLLMLLVRRLARRALIWVLFLKVEG